MSLRAFANHGFESVVLYQRGHHIELTLTITRYDAIEPYPVRFTGSKECSDAAMQAWRLKYALSKIFDAQ